MRHDRLLCALFFCVTILCGSVASADEPVARATIQEMVAPIFGGTVPVVKIDSTYQVEGHLANPDTRAAVNRVTFRVYTKEEVDAKQAQDKKEISDLQDLVAVLRQNLKDLSHVNDALAKRLDEMEKRLNKNE